MPRTEDELRLAKQRLERAIALLNEELYSVDQELRSGSKSQKLDERFFWSHVVGTLIRSKGGLTSAQLYEALVKDGLNLSKDGLRVFLSRYKDRGKLQLIDSPSALGRWRISKSTADAALKLGFSQEQD